MSLVGHVQLLLSITFPQYPTRNESRSPVGRRYLGQWRKPERVEKIIAQEEATEGGWAKIAQQIDIHSDDERLTAALNKTLTMEHSLSPKDLEDDGSVWGAIAILGRLPRAQANRLPSLRFAWLDGTLLI